jgi:hypothetical protein
MRPLSARETQIIALLEERPNGMTKYQVAGILFGDRSKDYPVTVIMGRLKTRGLVSVDYKSTPAIYTLIQQT